MNFFDTLKDRNVKAVFKVLAPRLVPTNGQGWEEYTNRLTFEERWKIFAAAHDVLKAVNLPNGDQPHYTKGN